MNYWKIASIKDDINQIQLYKGSNINSLTRRKGVIFVHNGIDWLLESNGKLFTNVIDDLVPRYGRFIQYVSNHTQSRPWIFEKIINLLLAGKYISKESAEFELTKLKEWRQKQKTNRIIQEFVDTAEEIGIDLTKEQMNKLKRKNKCTK